MKRTQLYISDEVFEILNVLARQRKKTISELVREAIRKTYIQKKSLDPIEVINQASGLWRDRKDIKSGAYVRKLRRDRRLERFGLADD